MAYNFSPKVVTNGLVLYLDAANPKSYNTVNLALNSEALNLWGNNAAAISITPNVEIAPDGTLTADRLAQTSANPPPSGANRWISSTTRTYLAGVTYTLSIWLKKVSGVNPQPNIWLWVNGAFILGGGNTVGTITNEWVRYTRTFTPVTTVTNTLSGLQVGWNVNGVANDFVFTAWGFQIEVGPVATTYVPSTNTWTDLSKGNYNGTLTNNPTYDTNNYGSIVFDGVDDFINFDSNPLSSFTSITYDCWFKFIAPIKNTFLISSTTFRVYYQDNANFFIAFNGINRTFYWPFITSWTNFVYSFNGTTHSVFINGIEIPTSLGAGTSAQPNLRISGRNLLGAEANLRGNIASTKIYNRALSQQEILQNYNTTKTRFGL